jgi:putative transposase
MTYEKDYTISEELMEEVCEQGFEALPELMRIVLNAAMYIERQKHIGAGPYERTPERQGQANGFKPKTVATRMGEVTMAIPQVRDCDFYPNSLDKGIRSERALKLALAEMYVQGVSTRKVAAITEQMCGFSVSSSQVSKATAELDEQLLATR